VVWSRVLVLSIALGAPFWLASRAAAGLVAPLSRTLVAALSAAVAPLESQSGRPLEEQPENVVAPAPLELSFEPIQSSGERARVRSRAPVKPGPPAALFVSQATVLRLAQTSARPRGSFVAETADHPAGLLLSGVAGLGIGVRDGDILVDALGAIPRSAGQVIGAIIEARAKQARYLSGRIWRQGQTFAITVEQPYVPAPPASPG
jgi:hypothetical protein